VVTPTCGGGYGGWDAFDFGSSWGGYSGGSFDGASLGGGGGDEAPVGEEVVVTADPLPYTIPALPDGSEIITAYDFATGQSYFISIAPDGSTFTGSQPFDVTDFSIDLPQLPPDA
jgi:hypothetical protein